MAAEKVPALVLDPRNDDDGNPTVPLTWHTVVGLPGFYFPGEATCVGGTSEATLDQAQAASDDDGCGVTLVQITTTEAGVRRRAHTAHLKEARGVVARAVKSARRGELDGGDVERINDELAATGHGADAPKED